MSNEIKKIPHLTLLDLATPKKNKDTVNLLIDLYNDVKEVSDNSNKMSANALIESSTAKTKSKNALAIAQAANATASGANATANSANSLSTSAKEIADNANTIAATAETNSANAVQIANDAVSKVQYALDTGNLGTYVRDNNQTLFEMQRTSDANLLEDVGDIKYLPTNTAIKNYIKNNVLESAPYIFAKEEREKGLNKLNVIDMPSTTTNGITYKASNGVITLNGTSTAEFGLIMEAYISKGTYAYNLFIGGETTDTHAWGLGNTSGEYTYFNTVGYYPSLALTSDIVTIRLWIGSGSTFTNYTISPMLIEGSEIPTTFVKFYGDICRTGDSEQKFLFNEYTKSLNLFNIYNYQLLASELVSPTIIDANNFTLNGTDVWQKCNVIVYIEPNTTYTLSYGISDGHYWRPVITDDKSNELVAGSWQGDGNTTTIKFTTTSNSSYIIITFCNQRGSTYGELTYSNVMLNKGIVALPYQPYYGEIVHRGDIEGITAWENASPNSSIASSNMSLSVSMNDLPRGKIYYKVYSTSFAEQCMEFVYLQGKGIMINSVSSYDMLMRRKFTLTNDKTISFENGYLDGVEDNATIIPTRIELFK